MGIRIYSAAEGKAKVGFDFRQELVGNFVSNILHGGVIAFVLDVVVGLAVMASYPDQQSLHGMGTVDLRVDYLHQGRGKNFIATAETVRPGGMLVSPRMELHNGEQVLIAIGTAIYH